MCMFSLNFTLMSAKARDFEGKLAQAQLIRFELIFCFFFGDCRLKFHNFNCQFFKRKVIEAFAL